MRSLFFVLILLTCFAATAQQQLFPPSLFARPDSLPVDTSLRVEAGVYGNYAAGSNAVTNAFLKKLYIGGYIDSSLKRQSYDRLQLKNRLGADADAGVYARWHCRKNPQLETFAALRFRQHADAAFSDDAFRFIFSGNRPFAGDTIRFDELEMNSYSWKQLQGGVSWHKQQGDGSRMRLTGSLSFLAGSSMTQLRIPEGSIYTDSSAQYLELDASYEMQRSDSASRGFSAMNGFGGGADLSLEVIAPAENGKAGRSVLFGIYLSDLAFIHWNAQTLHYAKDTAIFFDGYHVDFQDIKDSTLGTFDTDTLTGQAVKKTHTTLLPWSLSVEYGFGYKDGKMLTLGGLRMRNQANALPEAYIRQTILLGAHGRLSLEAGYGGYNRFRAGLDVQANLGKGWLLRTGCSNALGYLLPGATGGQGAYAAIAVRF